MNEPLVSVIIPTFNRKYDLEECIKSVIASNYKNYEIIVIDDNSTDGTYEYIKQRFPFIKIIHNSERTGPAMARNLGIKLSKGKFLFFLDDDVVIDNNCIKNLVKATENIPNCKCAIAVLYYYDEPRKILAAGVHINLASGRPYYNYVNTYKNLSEPFETHGIGAALFIHRNVIKSSGMFDNNIFFFGYEDADFCFRIIRSGYKILCIPTAKAWHKSPLTKIKNEARLLQHFYYIARNRTIFIFLYANTLQRLVFVSFFIPMYMLYYTALSIKYKSPKSAVEYIKGLKDAFDFIIKRKYKFSYNRE